MLDRRDLKAWSCEFCSRKSYDQPWDQLMRGMLMVNALVINIVLYLFHDVKLTLKVFVEAQQCALSCIAMLNERLASSKPHIASKES